VFSPIAHGHNIEQVVSMPNGWAWWMEQVLPWLHASDECYVLQIPGWATSNGVLDEMHRAACANKPVRFIEWKEIERCIASQP
jgi:hypothetical protein